jgi:hypothetical protein
MHTNAPEGISRNHLLEIAKKCGLIGGYHTFEMLDAIEGYARVVLADKAVQEAFVVANQHLLNVDAGRTASGEGLHAWLRREMPEGTVIGDPDWWATRIHRVALAELTANAGGNATERSEGRVDHNVGRKILNEERN